jgi:hypothetical protein
MARESRAPLESFQASQLIVLLDERTKIRKAKHHNKHDQQDDYAEPHRRNQSGVDERRNSPRCFRRRTYGRQLGRHLEVSLWLPLQRYAQVRVAAVMLNINLDQWRMPRILVYAAAIS